MVLFTSISSPRSVTNDLNCFVNWDVGEQGGHVKADQHLILLNSQACHQLHKVLGVPHMRVCLAC